jgi:hypothetical protein
MATQSYDSALDFLPEAEKTKTGGPKGIVGAIKAFFAAINDGLEAQHEYKTLTSRGMPTAKAAQAAFSDHLKHD